jgi:hypothetical protein
MVIAELRSAWGALSWLERAALRLSAVLVCAALLWRPVLPRVCPSVAVQGALVRGDAVDPWDRAWVNDLWSSSGSYVHSCGPDGADQNGGGDDVSGILGPNALGLDAHGHPSTETMVMAVAGWALAPLLGVAALGLAWLVAVPWLWSMRRRALAVESAVALVLAAPLGAVAIVGVIINMRFALGVNPAAPMLVSPAIALATTACAASYLLCIARRLSRPSQDADADAPEPSRAADAIMGA